MGKKKSNQARFVKFFLVVVAMFLALIIATKYTQNQSDLKDAPQLEHNSTK